MKRLTLIITSLLIGSMIFTGCKKSSDSASSDGNNSGGNTPTAKFFYKIDKTDGSHIADDCFKYNITYYTGPNDSVVLNNISLPWRSDDIIVKEKPFKAILKGIMTYQEDELPVGNVTFYAGRSYAINMDGLNVFYKSTMQPFKNKDKFLEYMASQNASHLLTFTAAYTWE